MAFSFFGFEVPEQTTKKTPPTFSLNHLLLKDWHKAWFVIINFNRGFRIVD
jgi:hypothetical protein